MMLSFLSECMYENYLGVSLKALFFSKGEMRISYNKKKNFHLMQTSCLASFVYSNVLETHTNCHQHLRFCVSRTKRTKKSKCSFSDHCHVSP